MQSFSSDDAISWVDQNAKKIAGHSRKYLPFAPYDQEDFLQDAYEAALEAVLISTERQIPFPACFWVLYKSKISAVTPNPSSRRNAGSSSPPRSICDWSDFSAALFEQADSSDRSTRRLNIDIDQIYPLIRQFLTSVEERILEALLGIHTGPMKIKETARHLGCSPANIRQALNRACNRISQLIANGELNIQFVHGKIICLSPFNKNDMPETHEVLVKSQDLAPEAITKRVDTQPEESTGIGKPRPHQDSPMRRKNTFLRVMASDSKIHQLPIANRGIGACEHSSLSVIGTTSLSTPDFSRFRNPWKTLEERDITGSHSQKMTDWNYDFNQVFMMNFVQPIQQRNRHDLEKPFDPINGEWGRRTTASPIHSRILPNKTTGIFSYNLKKYPLARPKQRMPATVQEGSNAEPLCRSGPIYIFSHMPPAWHPVQQRLSLLAA